ncbi:hypothetical protein MH117_17535 [Paenibacillus sp. ACRRX]|nr:MULTISPECIES: hypothetical protein [unclassified Paenibacillus]MCG7409223.1 hypothetical protein [Paenibacillus sp. ACRRX]MDK8181785.1 hypothetical protein [Paenibacillus sp. UMB4589-SE434]
MIDVVHNPEEILYYAQQFAIRDLNQQPLIPLGLTAVSIFRSVFFPVRLA